MSKGISVENKSFSRTYAQEGVHRHSSESGTGRVETAGILQARDEMNTSAGELYSAIDRILAALGSSSNLK
jgi:hypothetical protein